jgi:phenylalanine-4-hydroxylase
MDEAAGHAILSAQTVEECVIDQKWGDYTTSDHLTWRTLYNRQMQTLANLACEEYLAGIKTLFLTADCVPDFEMMNHYLRAATGWEVVAVPGLIASKPFFSMLANKQFPAGTFIRKPEQLDYLEEPDIFHDVLGHVPLLTNPAYANYMQEYGRAGLVAVENRGTKFLARLNWYTIEFGLIKCAGEIKAYGAGIMSSFGEANYLLKDPSSHYVQFNLERVLRTGYYIDDFQSTYFVINSFEELFTECSKRSFLPLYQNLREKPTLTPFEPIDDDHVVRLGTAEYTKRFAAEKTKLK